MPNIAAGISPAIQAFFQMRQFLDARHAAGQESQGQRDAVSQYMPGAPSPLGPMGPPQEPQAPAPGIAALGQAPSPMGGAPSPVGGGAPPSPNIASIIEGLRGMGSPMPGGAQGSPPSPLSAGGASPAGAQGQPGMQPQMGPPPPPPRDESMSSTAAPVPGGDFKDQSSATLAAVAKSITTSVPGITPERLYHAMHSQIDMMKGVAPEAKAYMQSQVGMARLQEQAQRDAQASDDRIARLEEDLTKAREQIAGRQAVGADRNAQSDTNNRRTTSTSSDNNRRTTSTSAANNQRTTSTSAGNARYRGDVSTENNKRTTGESRYRTDHPRVTGSKYDRQAEIAKTVRTLIAQGIPADKARQQATQAIGEDGGSSQGSYANLGALVAAQKAGKVSHADAIKMAKAKGWVQ